MPRYLLTHPESSCLFEVQTHAAAQHCCSEGCENVTNIAEYERRFNLEKEKIVVQRRTVATSKKQEVAPVQHSDPYHIRYRPTKLSEVIGHKEVVKALDSMLNSKSRSHTFLFTGQKGIGKTTFARILAHEFQCDDANIVEVDAATTNGVDDMRGITETMRFNGFGDQPNKMFILDECHMLSKQAWGALLKACEEPPNHVFFCFCTTEDGKVPDTIVSRAQSFNLKPLRNDDIMDLLEFVVDEEKLDTDTKILQMIARGCEGSPRVALTQLQKLSSCEDEEEVAILLEQPLDNIEVIDLCRAMVSDKLDWKTVQTTIKSLNETVTPESARIVMVNYLNSCLLNAKGERDVPRLLDLLASFSKPCQQSDKWAGILLAIGNSVFPVN